MRQHSRELRLGGHIVLDAVFEVVERIDLGKEEHFGVGGPEHNHLIVALLALPDVGSQCVDEFLVGAVADIVSTVSLVGSDEIGVQNGFQRLDVTQVILKLLNQSGFKNVGTSRCLVKVFL